jgi:hypothetical protein
VKKVKLSDYFNIESSIQDDKMNFQKESVDRENAVPFLGRSALNNGIVGYVSKREGYINSGGVISIALDGSTGATFYQHHNFSSGQNIWLLIPKRKYFVEFDPKIALFCITSIRKAVENYVGSYNLSLTKTRLTKNIEIFLPLNEDGTVDNEFIGNAFSNLRNIELIEKIPTQRHF